MVLGRAAINDLSNSRVLERLLMYERRIENSLYKTLDELHKRKLVREIENANKAIETEEFDMAVHPQASAFPEGRLSAEAATLEGNESPGFVQLRRGKKNAKQSQFLPAQNGITSFTKEDYEKKTNPASKKNKPNQSQSGVVCDYTGIGPAVCKRATGPNG